MAGSAYRCFKGRFMCIPSGLPSDSLLELSKVSAERQGRDAGLRLHELQPLVFMGVFWLCHLCHLANEDLTLAQGVQAHMERN